MLAPTDCKFWFEFPKIRNLRKTFFFLIKHRLRSMEFNLDVVSGTFHLLDVKAQNLPAEDYNGSSDPYFIFSWNTLKYKSKVKKKQLNARWSNLEVSVDFHQLELENEMKFVFWFGSLLCIFLIEIKG